MLYKDVVDEELAIIAELQAEAPNPPTANEIQVPLESLMHTPPTIPLGTNIEIAIDLMLSCNTGYVLVVSDDELAGIFTERDVLVKVPNDVSGGLPELPVSDFMKAKPQTASAQDSLDTAILYMAKGGYRHLPIIDAENRPVGVVSVRDIISHLVEHFPQDVLTLPPAPIRSAMKAREGA